MPEMGTTKPPLFQYPLMTLLSFPRKQAAPQETSSALPGSLETDALRAHHRTTVS